MGGSKKQTVGYEYYLGMHMVLCHGPIDCISRIQVDKRDAWTGVNTGGTLSIDAPTLFGGGEREGGVSGLVDIDMGDPSQGQNAYLLSQLGSLLPAFRGVVSAVLNRCYLGNNPYLKSWSFLGSRIYRSTDGELQWYPEKAAITRDPDNPIIFAGGGGETVELPVTVGYPDWVLFDMETEGVPVSAIDAGNASFYTSFTLDMTGASQGNARVEWEFYGSGGYPGDLLSTDAQDGDVNEPDAPFDGGFNLPVGTRYVRIRFVGVPLNNGTGFAGLLGETSAFSYIADVVPSQPNADMNPAHIIRECLINQDWGMGYQASDIDDDSFTAAADLFWDECLGLSLLWDRQTLLEDFIKEVARHVDTALYVSRQTGKFVLKPIRADYDVETLIVLDESNINKVMNPEKPTFGELSNSITVKFWNHLTSEDDSVSVEDPALVLMQGTPIGTTVQYPGFTTHRNATVAAQRDLAAVSSSKFSCTIYAQQIARNLNIGDTFKFTWPRWQLDELVMRVSNISYGNGKNNEIRIVCTEDKYSTPLQTVVTTPPTEWVDPSQPPVPVARQLATEAPYYELVQQFGQTAFEAMMQSNIDLAYVVAAAGRAESATNARLWVDAGAGYEDSAPLDFCPTATLASGIDANATSISFLSGVEVDEIIPGTFFQMGEEICRIDSVDTGVGVMGIGRGCLDTTPRKHLAGTVLFFWDQLSGSDPTEYLSGEVLDVKVTPSTGAGTLPIDDASAMSVTMVGRAWRPYAPGQFQINSEYYPLEPIDAPFTASWVGRDRLQQTSGEIYDHTFGNIGPETGTTYRARMFIDDVLIDTVEPATSGLTFTPTVEGLVRVEVHSLRDGVYSFQPAMHEIYYATTAHRALVDGSILETQDGDVRVTED